MFVTFWNLLQIHDLFSNHSWTDNTTITDGHQAQMLDHWTTPYTGVFTSLVIYIFATFWLSIFAATLPVPTGVLVPAFKIGAAFGRIVGEGMNVWFPEGFSYDNDFRWETWIPISIKVKKFLLPIFDLVTLTFHENSNCGQEIYWKYGVWTPTLEGQTIFCLISFFFSFSNSHTIKTGYLYQFLISCFVI